MKIRRIVALLSTVIGLVSAAAPAGAQSYPQRPITIVVGSGPGGVPDTLMRYVGARLSEALGQPVVIDNRPGAGGIIAMNALVRAAPDGYTLASVTTVQAVFAPFLFSKLRYDPLRDLEPVANIATGAMVLAAHPDLPVKDMQGLLAYSRAHPDKLFLGLPGTGSVPHVIAAQWMMASGLKATLLPHRTGTDAVNSAIGGKVQLLMDAPTIIAPQVQAGRLQALAVSGRQRESSLPGVPTMAESGWPGLEGESWIGLVGPRGMPAAVVERLNRAVNDMLATPEARSYLEQIAFRPEPGSAAAFRQSIVSEQDKWGEVIRKAGIRAN